MIAAREGSEGQGDGEGLGDEMLNGWVSLGGGHVYVFTQKLQMFLMFSSTSYTEV